MNNPLDRFLAEIDRVDREIDVPTAALYVAQVEYPDLEIEL
jgi:hypothetical protein